MGQVYMAEQTDPVKREFEQGQFHSAVEKLGAIMPRFPEDRPTRHLLTRAIAHLDDPSGDFSGVWTLPTK